MSDWAGSEWEVIVVNVNARGREEDPELGKPQAGQASKVVHFISFHFKAYTIKHQSNRYAPKRFPSCSESETNGTSAADDLIFARSMISDA